MDSTNFTPLERAKSPTDQVVYFAKQSANATARAGISFIRNGIGQTIENTGEAIRDGSKLTAKFGAAAATFLFVAMLTSQYHINPREPTTIPLSAVLTLSAFFTGGKPLTFNDPFSSLQDTKDALQLVMTMTAGCIIVSVMGTMIQKLGKRITEERGSAASNDKKIEKVAISAIQPDTLPTRPADSPVTTSSNNSKNSSPSPTTQKGRGDSPFDVSNELNLQRQWNDEV